MKLLIIGRSRSGKPDLAAALVRELGLPEHDVVLSGPDEFRDAIRDIQTDGHDVLLSYVRREPDVGDPRDAMESVLFQPIEDRIAAVMDMAASDAILYPNAPPSVETLFGEDLFVQCPACLGPEALARAVEHVRNVVARARPAEPGALRRFPCKEPIVLESRDWGSAEWSALCRICRLKPFVTTKIVLHAGCVEAAIVP